MSLHYAGETRLYVLSTNHPLPPNRSLKSAVNSFLSGIPA